jgi:CheY-like chemotaxis protein
VENGSGIILIVDDEQIARSVATKVLERCGFAVLSAQDGHEGVEIFSKRYSEIKAVLLDLSMPDLSGQEVLKQMHQIQSNVRVILSSGYNEQSAVARFSGMKLAGFLQKPYRPAALIDKFKELVNPRQPSKALS